MTNSTTYISLTSSTFQDYNGYGGPDPSVTLTSSVVTNLDHNLYVALILKRQNDPTALLESDWATRQSHLSGSAMSGTLASYGADAGRCQLRLGGPGSGPSP